MVDKTGKLVNLDALPAGSVVEAQASNRGGLGVGFSLGNTLKKAANVVTQTAAGFVGGGSVGAVYGLAKGVKDNTKTGEAHTTDLRTAGQALVGGAVANVAAGAVLAGAHALAAPAAAGGGFSLTGSIGKATAWAKTGGVSGLLVNNFGNIVKAGAQFLSKGGATPQTVAAPYEGSNDISGSDATGYVNKALTGYRNIRGSLPNGAGKDFEAKVRSNIQDKTRDVIAGYAAGEAPGGGSSTGVTVNNSSPGSGSNSPLLAGAALLAMFFVFRKKHA